MFDKQQEEARKNAEKDRDIARDKAQYREDLLKSTLVKAMGVYSNVKKARRFLRARAIEREGQEKTVLGEQYDVYLEMINDAQLELENLARDIATSSPAFSDPRSLEATVWRMESYLDKLIGEYEDVRGNFQGQTPWLAFAELPLLKEFIGPSKGSRFKAEFSDSYHEIQRAIRADLLHPNLRAA
jgi:hypothetical protein